MAILQLTLFESGFNILALDKAVTERNVKDKEAVLEEAAEDFSPPSFFTPEVRASGLAMFVYVNKLPTTMCKNLKRCNF